MTTGLSDPSEGTAHEVDQRTGFRLQSSPVYRNQHRQSPPPSTIQLGIDLTGEEITSTNPKAPAYRLLARTPRGRSLEIGGIWKKTNQTGGDYYTLSVNTGYGRLNANLGRFPGQDDVDLMAVIPWD